MLIAITGKTGSGKTALRKNIEKHGFSPIITTTTRSPRAGEIEGIDYNFMSKDCFLPDEFALVGKNDAGDFYGIRKNVLFSDEHRVLVTWRAWIDEIDNLVQENILKYRNIISVYLDFSNFTLMRRLLRRGDKKDAIRSRLRDDTKKFYWFEPKIKTLHIHEWNIQEITKIIINNILTK